MRIGTWNLDHRWTASHGDFLTAAACDVWLLTELVPTATPDGYHLHWSRGRMARGQHYAAIAHHGLCTALPEVHFASVAVRTAAVTFCCSVLPWRSAGTSWDDPTPGTGERTIRVLNSLGKALPHNDLVWGGDFNHELSGPLTAGSRLGREAINSFLAERHMTAHTQPLPHRLGGLSIDHIAIPDTWTVTLVDRISATGLSDHDAYILDAHNLNADHSPTEAA